LAQEFTETTPASLREAFCIDTQKTESLCCEAAGIIHPISSPTKALIPHDKLREAAPVDATLIAKNSPHAQPAEGYTPPSAVSCIVAAMDSILAEQAGIYATSESMAQAIEVALQQSGLLMPTDEACQTLRDRLDELVVSREAEQRKHHHIVDNLKRTITELEERIMSYTGMPVTRPDYDLLIRSAETLRLAEKTWKAAPGTDPWRNRATQQMQDIQALATRVHSQLRATPAAAATAGEAA
jgi:phosphopantetheine adenylyltransferase